LKHRARAIGIVAMLSLGGAVHAAADPLTLDQVQKMTTPKRAERLLGAAGGLMRESEVSDGTGPFNGRPSLSGVDFASLPRSAGFSGICEADIAMVTFEPVDKADRSATSPARVRDFFTDHRFKIIPALVDVPQSDKNWRALDHACRDAGPVLTRWHQPVHRGFFGGFIDGRGDLKAVDVSFAARALVAAQHALGGSGGMQVMCAEDRAEPAANLCAHASEAVTSLDWSRLLVVSLSSCEDTRARCVKLEFDRDSALSDADRRLVVTLTTDTNQIDPPAARIGIRDISLSGETLVE
jgi:hypothetical protein